MIKLNGIFKGDAVVWIVFLALAIISIIEVFSATSTLTYAESSFFNPIKQHVEYYLLGLVVVFVTHRIPCHLFKALIPLGLLFSVVTLVCVLAGWGVQKNNAERWIKILGITIQPSEIAKCSLIITVAYILSIMQTDHGADKRAIKYILIFSGVICGLIFPDNFSTAAILFGVVVLMMFVGRVPMKQLGALFGVMVLVGGIMLSVLASLSPEQINAMPKNKFTKRIATWSDRIQSFSNKGKVYDATQSYLGAAGDSTAGADGGAVPAATFAQTANDSVLQAVKDSIFMAEKPQEAHARVAVALSNVLGCGPGNSVQRDFLSQAYSDFIYVIIVEEIGLVGGVLVVLLYLVLFIRVSYIARRCEGSCFPPFLAMGLALMLCCQAMVNMLVATGIFPVTGQPLPLISRGGTSIIINSVYIGMILSVSRLASKKEKNAPALIAAADDTDEEALAEELRDIPPAEQTARDIEAGKFD